MASAMVGVWYSDGSIQAIYIDIDGDLEETGLLLNHYLIFEDVALLLEGGSLRRLYPTIYESRENSEVCRWESVKKGYYGNGSAFLEASGDYKYLLTGVEEPRWQIADGRIWRPLEEALAELGYREGWRTPAENGLYTVRLGG